MKKFYYLLISLMVIFLSLAFSACGMISNEDTNFEIKSISAEGFKTDFLKGEDFSVGNIVIKITYSNNTTETIAISDCDVDSSNYNKDEVGTYEITVTYEGKSYKYNVTVADNTVTEKAIVSISATGYNTEFLKGEEFSVGNIVVTATYDDDTTETILVSDCEVESSNYNKDVVGTYEITVTYEGKSYKYNVTVTDNTIYYTLNVDGGSGSGKYIEGETITIIANEKGEGYTFDGWYNGAEKLSNELKYTFKLTKDMSITAKWIINTYTVIFDCNGGSLVTPISNITHGTTISLPTEPFKDNYKFSGWFLDNNTFENKFSSDTLITSDIILYAKWILLENASAIVTANDFTIKNTTLDYNKEIRNATKEIDLRGLFTVSDNTTWRAFYSEDCQSQELTTRKATLNEGLNKVYVLVENQTTYQQSIYTLNFYKNKKIKISLKLGDGFSLGESYENVEEGYCYTNPVVSEDYDGIWYADAQLTTLWDFEKDVIEIDTILYGYAVTSKNLGYSIIDGVCSVSGIGTFKGTFLSIPNEHDSIAVTEITSDAFLKCNKLLRVTIPDSVTSIGSGAFSGCSGLTDITIPDSVTSIGSSAFEDCRGLTSITIPDSIKSIGGYAFRGCSGLTSITIGNRVTSIGDDAFDGTGWYNNQPNGLVYAGKVAYTYKGTMPENTSITLKSDTKGIADYAFEDCRGLTSITIPNSVTDIGYKAFSGCSGLTDITIPDSVTSIGEHAFENCSGLKKVNITDLASWCNIKFSAYDSNPLYNAHKLYLNNELVTDLVIPDSVTSIGDYAFEGCRGLTSITIPNSVTSIGNNAFKGCSGLTSVTIPNSVTSIDYGAFYGCSDLTSVTIPDSVTSIGEHAFENCSGLKKVNITDLASWCNIKFSAYDSNPLYNAHKLYLNNELVTDLVIPDSVTSIGDYAFEGCRGLTSITIPNSVTSIGNNAFYGCSGLTNITIPDSVTSIGNNAFYKCSSLTSITIPNSVTSIGYDAFYKCSSLTSITIPDSVTSIGNSAFAYCSGLTSVTIPNSVTSIGSGAFSGCSGLTSVTIPDGVTSIGNNAFYGCSGLTNITIPDGVTSIDYGAFENCSGLTSVTIPDSVTSIGDSAFSGCSGLTSVTIPDSVTSIGDSAFSGCSGLTNVTIPNSVTSIGEGAFSGCSKLTSITIPNSVTSIGDWAFYNCSSLTKVYYKGTATEWNNITIGADNPSFTNATRYYYSETQPTTSGNYWHYGTDGKTPVIWVK